MARVELNGLQVKFLQEMLEIKDGQKAMQYFAEMMAKEGIDTHHMPAVVDHCIKKLKEKAGKK